MPLFTDNEIKILKKEFAKGSCGLIMNQHDIQSLNENDWDFVYSNLKTECSNTENEKELFMCIESTLDQVLPDKKDTEKIITNFKDNAKRHLESLKE